MKKVFYIVLMTLLIISGCTTKDELTLNDLDLSQYLVSQDPFVTNYHLNGQYSLINVQDDMMEVAFSSENEILKYDTKYNIINQYDGQNWHIVSFEKEYNSIEVKNIDSIVVEKLKNYCSSSTVGVFENLKYSIVDNGYLSFRADYNSLDGSFNSSYEGIVKYENSTISLSNVKETIKDPLDHPIISYNQSNILQHYLSLNVYDSVDSIYDVKEDNGLIYATVKTTNLYRYIAETYDIEVVFSLDNDELVIREENVVNTEVKSRVVGKFINENNPYGSYILLNENFTYTILEYNGTEYTLMDEYYRIDDDMLYLYNREYLLSELAEIPFKIDSLTQISSQENIITTLQDDRFILSEQLKD